MSVSLVLTVIGDDRPGLVEQLATAVSQHQGNWLESSMSNLSGKFAGIVCVSIAEGQLEALMGTLEAMPDLRITSEVARSPSSTSGNRRLKLSLVAHDRVGIVREVSQILARHALNVEDLSTYTASAPMSAGMLFHADVELTALSTLDLGELTRELENLSDDLMVDISLDEALRT